MSVKFFLSLWIYDGITFDSRFCRLPSFFKFRLILTEKLLFSVSILKHFMVGLTLTLILNSNFKIDIIFKSKKCLLRKNY